MNSDFQGIDSTGTKWQKEVPSQLMNNTIDECFAKKEKECMNPWSYLIPFFCGSELNCMKRDKNVRSGSRPGSAR